MTALLNPKPQIIKLPRLLLSMLLFIIVTALFVPFSPKMPALGLDASWATGINQAVSQGFHFGRQVIFTLGPYASIYTKVFHPATDNMMIWGSLYLAFIYWLALIQLLRDEQWQYWAFTGFVLICLIYSRDALLFSYPLLLSLVCHKRLSNHDTGIHKTVWVDVLLFTPLGLLPLIKGSLLLLSASTVILCCLYCLSCRRLQTAIQCLLIPPLSAVFFWSVAGQSPQFLVDYFINSTLIAIHFGRAMADHAPLVEVIIFLLASSALLLAIYGQKTSSTFGKLFLLSVSFCFLFISFKAGFTRHQGHVYIAGTSLIIASTLLSIANNKRLTVPTFIFAFACGLLINKHYTQLSLVHNFMSRYQASYHGLKDRLFNPTQFEENYAIIMRHLAEQSHIPKMQGSSDIYSYQQTALIASGSRWSPRPIMQSYSTFAAKELQTNALFLSSINSPENIVFQLTPIDDRLPALEDSASWPILLRLYTLQKKQHSYLILHKNKRGIKNHNQYGANLPSLHSTPLKTVKQSSRRKSKLKHVASHLYQGVSTKATPQYFQLGERITLADGNDLLFAKVNIRNSLWGLACQFLYKNNPLFIHLWLADGSEKNYRFIASMANSSFLLSPLVENTSDFAKLYRSSASLSNKTIKAFSIENKSTSIRQWQETFSVNFQTLQD